MNEAGHRGALEELRSTRAKLDPTGDIRSYGELSHGMAIHAVAAGALRRHGIDLDNHQGMARWLQQRGYPDVGVAVAEIETIRTGRWYGRQGNGNTAHRLNELLAAVEAWSVA